MKLFYSPAYVGSGYAFDTTRKAMWIADDVERRPIRGVELAPPEPLSWDDLVRVHDVRYVQAVQTGTRRDLAESQGFPWDPGLWPMVLATNGGAVAAARQALESGVAGSLSSGMHHARRERGVGFCTFNGLAIAAREALSAGAGAVLILDLDAHCGGGTASLIVGDPRIWQIDVPVCDFDAYREGPRAWLRLVVEASEYLGEIERALQDARRAGPRFDLCLYNAGMDPFEECSIGGLDGITREILAARERLVFDWCREAGTAVAFFPAGGYVSPGLDRATLVGLHRLTVAAAAGHAEPATTQPPR